MAKSTGGWKIYLTGGLCLIVAAGGVFYISHGRGAAVAAAREELETKTALGPQIQTVAVTKSPAVRDVRLLGDAKPFATSTLFSKVAGYLKTISVDKGDQVKAGQVLAEIDSAETDALYDSAQADLANKRKLADRDRDLLTRGNVALQSQQTSDTNMRMAQQNVRNLATIKSYESIRAPFDGTVTARYADPGALMPAATTNQATSLPVVTISDTTKLRVSVYVEQRDAAFIHIGDVADITDATDPERKAQVKISRTAGALDPKTRTLYIELDVDNKDNVFVPGSFVYVSLHLKVPSFMQLPVSALIIRNNISYVADITDKGEIKFHSVKVAGTDGDVITLTEGVEVGEKVAINLPGEVVEGDHVQLVQNRK